MKKLVGIIAMLFLLALPTTMWAAPKSYTLFLSTAANELSGTTSAAVGGVSKMVLQGSGFNRSEGATILPLQGFTGGMGAAHMTGTSMCQNAMPKGGVNTGVTFSLSVAVAQSAADILNADRTPIYQWEAISGETVTPRVFQLPRGDFACFLFGSGSGTSLFSGVTFEVTLDIPENQNWLEPLPLVVQEGSFTMPLRPAGSSATAETGTSVFTSTSIAAWPKGVRYAEFQVISGSSAYYTVDGVTGVTNAGVGTGTPLLVSNTISMTREEARRSRWCPGATATTIWYRLLSRKPY